MESQYENINPWNSLQWQLNEGVDEWVFDEPLSRFDTQSSKPISQFEANFPQAATPQTMRAEGANAPTIAGDLPDFSSAQSANEISQMLIKTLSKLSESPEKLYHEKELQKPVDLLIFTDQPSVAVVNAQNFLADSHWQFFEITLNTIGYSLDNTKKTYAQACILPLFPWVLNYSKFPDEKDIELALQAYLLRTAFYKPKAIAYLSSHYIAGKAQFDNTLSQALGQSSIELVAPQAMLKNYILKRRHWQGLRQISEMLSN